MVTIQAVLVELVQDEAGKASEKKSPDQPRKVESRAPEGKPDPTARGKSELGLIDVDLSAPHETILAELRKLGVQGRLDVLNRIQMTTLDKQPASVHFGRQQPMIMGVSRTTFGQTNNVTLIQSGLIVNILPRATSTDAVILEIDLNESRLGRTEEGVAIFTSPAGETVRQPSIFTVRLQSVVKAPAGKTVVVVGATSESGPRRTETLLLVSARVVKTD